MKTQIHKYIVLYVIFLFTGGILRAGEFKTPAEEYDFYRKKYPDEINIMLTNKREIEIKIKDGRLRIYLTDIEEYLWLQQTPYSGTSEMVYFGYYSKIDNIEAYTLVPGEKSYKKLEVQKYDTIDYRAPGIFHDDSRAVKFSFLGIKKGSKTYLKTTHELLEPRLINTFLINAHVSIEESELTVKYPSEVNLGYKIANPGNIKIDINEISKGNSRQITFNARMLKKFNTEDNDPGFMHYVTHIFVYIIDYNNKGDKYNVSGSLDNLYSWYKALIKDVNKAAGRELGMLTDSLVQGCNDDTCKIKSIYYWVQDHVQYLAFEDMEGAFVPRPADSVYRRRYGDCKDMANLLTVMLRHAGIKAFNTWIGSNDLPYRFTEYPLPSTSNHMIATVMLDENLYYLDATMRPIPFGLSSTQIQGKEAMIGIDEKNYRIAEVPVTSFNNNLVTDSINMNVVGEKIDGKGSCSLSGYVRHDIYNSLIEKKDENAKKEFLNNYLSKGNNKFNITKFDVYGMKNKEDDIKIYYNFELPGYMNKIGDEYFINMNLVRLKTDKTLRQGREIPYSLNYQWKVNETVILHVPEGYVVSGIPKGTGFDTEFFGYKVNYEIQPGMILMNHEYYEKFIELYPEHFNDWNKMIESLNETYSKSIILIKNTK